MVTVLLAATKFYDTAGGILEFGTDDGPVTK